MKHNKPKPTPEAPERVGKNYSTRIRPGVFGTFRVRVRVTRNGIKRTLCEDIVKGAEKAREHAQRVIAQDFWANHA